MKALESVLFSRNILKTLENTLRNSACRWYSSTAAVVHNRSRKHAAYQHIRYL